MRWVAVRGGIWDWAIYAQNPYYIETGVWDWQKIAEQGDKVHNENHIRKLVECDKEAFEMYRH